MRRVIALSGVLLCAMQVACGPSNAAIEARLAPLQKAIGAEPLSEKAAAALATEKGELEKLTNELETREPRKPSARRDWQVGECHRLRHLFDELDAWEESERRLSLAMAREPKFAPAHVSLGQLYLTGGFEYAPRAEHEFVSALENSGDTPLPAARKGLFIAYYYQGRWSDAVKEADRYLALAGDDTDVKKMREMAETNLTKGKKTT